VVKLSKKKRGTLPFPLSPFPAVKRSPEKPGAQESDVSSASGVWEDPAANACLVYCELVNRTSWQQILLQTPQEKNSHIDKCRNGIAGFNKSSRKSFQLSLSTDDR